MPDKWDQVKELFALALERDAEERSSSFLRQACVGDDSLRTEIESLLSSFDGSATFLEDSPVADMLSAQSRPMQGRKIGAHRIIREIGRGEWRWFIWASVTTKAIASRLRLPLAELDCDSGKDQAEQLSRGAPQAFRADAYADQEIFARSILSGALFQQGKGRRGALSHCRSGRTFGKNQDVMVRIP
jgi:hypothetical protein